MKTWHKLLVIFVAALLLRVLFLPFIQHPGIADPNHYYNVALRLLDGQGFTIDYIWQYFNPPAGLTHPIDYWMPLPAVLAAAGMWLFGHSVAAALLPFVILGSLLPVIAYQAARQLAISAAGCWFAAAAVAVLPELFISSLRSETVIVSAFCIGLLFVLLRHGLQTGSNWPFALSGVFLGLAYLTRSDSLLVLPVLLLVGLLHGQQWRKLLWIPALALLVTAPWLWRNVQVFGSMTIPGQSRMLYFTDFRDFYAYNRVFSLDTLLNAQTIPQIIGKRLFELGASIENMYSTFDIFLPVAVAGGLVLLLSQRDRARLRLLLPLLALIVIGLLVYAFALPLNNQGGSFKRFYLGLLPLLVPLGAYALTQAIPRVAFQIGAGALVVLFMTANSVELVRADLSFTDRYMNYMQTVADAARSLPDTNGDGTIVLMAQDPFMLRFVDIQAVMIPMADRETILAVAQRYQVDYIMMPPDRPALDSIFTHPDEDARLVLAADIPQINVKLFRPVTDAP